MPITAVIMAPCLKLILSGARFEKPLAGATMFAAILVVSVATISPVIESMIISGPPMRASKATGSAMRLPKITRVAFVTAAPMNANSAMVAGNPTACPTTWSRCDRA